MVEVLERYDIPCTGSLNTAVLDHVPEIATAMPQRGCDFMSHSLYNTRYVTGMSEAEERRLLATCAHVLEATPATDTAACWGRALPAMHQLPI